MPGHGLRNIDPAGSAIRLHECRGIHGIAPDIEGELPPTNDARYNRARMNADAQFECGQPHLFALCLHLRHSGLHFKRCQASIDWMPAS